MEIMIAFVLLVLFCGIGAWLVRKQQSITSSPAPRRSQLAETNEGYAKFVNLTPRRK